MQTRDVKTLGRLCKQQREDRDLSLRATAKETGISISTLSRIERGIGEPDFKQVLGLAKWLNVPLEVQTVEPRNSLEAIREILCADGNLESHAVPAMMEVIRTTYKLVARVRRNGKAATAY